MRRVALLAFVSALTGFIALPAAATPSFPPVPTYEGCTVWHLQDWYPMSPDDAHWAFTCEQTGMITGSRGGDLTSTTGTRIPRR